MCTAFFRSLARPLRAAAGLGSLALVCSAFPAAGQTDPPKPKPQLQTTPSTGTQPAATPPPPVIVAPDTARPAKPARAAQEEPKVKEEKPKVPFSKRLVFGGGGGMQFGDVTLIDLSPMVGYRFSDRIIAGPGVVYQYLSLRGYDSYHTYGGRLFGRAMIYQNFFGHTEYELLNAPRLTYDPKTDKFDEKRVNINSMLVGGGYRFMLGERSSLDALVLFNLIEQDFQRYNNPVIRIGFTGGW